MTSSMEARFGDATRAVPLPNPWDLTVYLGKVAAHRGRSLSLHQVPGAMLAERGCRGKGLWVARTRDDIIVYDADVTEREADHIILHEIGHMLLGHGDDNAHTGANIPLPPTFAVLLPALSTHYALGRAEFGTDREQEAEVFADMTMVYSTLPRKQRGGFRLFGRG